MDTPHSLQALLNNTATEEDVALLKRLLASGEISIGDYNPDWGVARYDGTKEKVILELVRETKGGTDIDKLRFTHEARKIRVAEKFFQTIGVNYRVVDDKTADWWKSATEQGKFL
jgi:hypothetical protein